jgi:hypothetical protein
MWKYYTVILILTPILILSAATEYLNFDWLPDAFEGYINKTLMGINIIFILMISFRLCKKSTSNILRKMVLKRYSIEIFLYSVYFWSRYINFKIDDKYVRNICIAEIVRLTILSLMLILRISEPFIYQNLKTDLDRILNCCKSKKEILKHKKYSSEPLCAFTNSAMNIEFVYLILVGINNFMEIQQVEEIVFRNQTVANSLENTGKSSKDQKIKI